MFKIVVKDATYVFISGLPISEKKERIRANDNNTTPGINQIKGAIESVNSLPKSKYINQPPKKYNKTLQEKK